MVQLIAISSVGIVLLVVVRILIVNNVVFYVSNSWSYTKLGKIVGKPNEE